MDCETRLAAVMGTQIIAIIEMFTPTNRVQRDPFAFTFHMTVCTSGTAHTASLSELTRMTRTGEVFQVAIVRADDVPYALWKPEYVLFERCIITAALPVNLTRADARLAAFNGLCHERVSTERTTETVPVIHVARAS